MVERSIPLVVVLAVGCAAPPPPPLEQTPPGETPSLFAPGVVSTSEAIELNGVLSPDGRELVFTRLVDGVDTMHRARLLDGAWTAPEPWVPYAGGQRAMAVDMSFSPDGKRLYFLGTDPDDPGAVDPLDLWFVERTEEGWSSAARLPEPLSTEADEIYPCVVGDGSLYFTSNRAGGFGKSDVWRAQRLPDGRFAAPVNVGAEINTEHSEGDTWVSPDERTLVVASSRPGGFGQGDLYVSFRDERGAWSTPVNLGPTINTAEVDYCPMRTWDGRWFFFSRRDGPWESVRTGDVFWIDAAVLERYR
jgi:hypothetical protein